MTYETADAHIARPRKLRSSKPARKPRGSLVQAVRNHLAYLDGKSEITAADKRSLDLATDQLLAELRREAGR